MRSQTTSDEQKCRYLLRTILKQWLQRMQRPDHDPGQAWRSYLSWCFTTGHKRTAAFADALRQQRPDVSGIPDRKSFLKGIVHPLPLYHIMGSPNIPKMLSKFSRWFVDLPNPFQKNFLDRHVNNCTPEIPQCVPKPPTDHPKALRNCQTNVKQMTPCRPWPFVDIHG